MTAGAGAALSAEIAFFLAGIVLAWTKVLSPSARARRQPHLLQPWKIAPADFILVVALACIGVVTAGAATSLLARSHPMGRDATLVVGGTAMHVGILAGLLAYRWAFAPRPLPARPPLAPALTSGAATFLVALPLLLAVSNVWESLLEKWGLPAEKQELVDILENSGSLPVRIGLIVIAIFIVPITEELLFRAGLYRYLRTRIPRQAAMILTAVLFGALHVNWSTFDGLASSLPLAVLAIVFCMAYERTGNIGTTIVAHALYNLNTVLLIASGATL